MERVGFVGLGIMGTPMARNALKAGFAVTVTNRTIDRAKPLADAGATAVRTPREVAERSDIVVTMVTNTPDVEAVMFVADGIASGAHEGLLAIDMSTIITYISQNTGVPSICRHVRSRLLSDTSVRGAGASTSRTDVGARVGLPVLREQEERDAALRQAGQADLAGVAAAALDGELRRVVLAEVAARVVEPQVVDQSRRNDVVKGQQHLPGVAEDTSVAVNVVA